MKLFGILAVAAGLAFAGQASAATYNFGISGSGFTGSGTVTTDDTALSNPYPCPSCASDPAYLVTAITGQLNGNAIDSLLPVGAFAGNDNLVYPASSGPQLDWGDLGFLSNGVDYNVFSGEFVGRPGYFLISSAIPGTFSNPVSFTLTAAVPEPSAWMLMILGVAGVGMAMRGSKRRSEVAASAA